MKFISIFLLITFLTGCTTFKPIGSGPYTVDKPIVSIDTFNVGERVRIDAIDGKHYELDVVHVTDEYVEGKIVKKFFAAFRSAEIVKVFFADIESVEVQKINVAGTVLFAAGLAVMFAMAINFINNNPPVAMP